MRAAVSQREQSFFKAYPTCQDTISTLCADLFYIHMIGEITLNPCFKILVLLQISWLPYIFCLHCFLKFPFLSNLLEDRLTELESNVKPASYFSNFSKTACFRLSNIEAVRFPTTINLLATWTLPSFAYLDRCVRLLMAWYSVYNVFVCLCIWSSTQHR